MREHKIEEGDFRRIHGLPQWAQATVRQLTDTIVTLRRENATLRGEGGPEDGPRLATRRLDEPMISLPKMLNVYAVKGAGTGFMPRVEFGWRLNGEDQRLQVAGLSELSIRPVASNVIEIDMDWERW